MDAVWVVVPVVAEVGAEVVVLVDVETVEALTGSRFPESVIKWLKEGEGRREGRRERREKTY